MPASLVVRYFCVALLLVTGAGCITTDQQPYFGKEPPQWLVHIRLGAKLPEMGDRLFVQVLDESGNLSCEDCAREFDVSTQEKQSLSFGVANTESTVRVRAQLYRSFLGREGGARMIDVTGRLPQLEGEFWPPYFIKVDLELPFGCFGRAPNVAEATTCQIGEDGVSFDGPEPTLRDLATFFVTDPPGTCTKKVPEGMRCAGSGVFVLGDDRIESLAFDFSAKPGLPTRIAAGAALMMDEDEMKVGTVRRLLLEQRVYVADEGKSSVKTRGPGNEPCTFLGKDDPTNDDLPINCIGQTLASDLCDVLGKRLPSELEFEFAASNGAKETLYPWGNPENEGVLLALEKNDLVCERAVIGRGRTDVRRESSTCGGAGGAAGPVAKGNTKDVTEAGIKNLGGNLGEWMEDDFAFYDEVCWVPFEYPCRKPSTRLEGTWKVYRGGSWASSPQAALAVARFAIKDGLPSPYVGFRCAKTEDELP